MSIVIITIGFALLFDFLNGFHDAANSIAAIVSTRVMKPHWAVLWAAFFNFIAFLFFGVHVATTIGTGLVDPHVITTQVIFSALLGAIFWNIFTWFYGLPSSSSHALIGGLLGASVAYAGIHPLKWVGISKVLAAIVISPLLGMVISMILIVLTARIFFYTNPQRVEGWFRHFQFLSSAFISLGHGSNDAQKTMGIIAILLYSSGMLGSHFYVPAWVVILCNFVIAFGTVCGGWRIVKTMGMKITKLRPLSGFCSDTASATTLALATTLGIPVSTTHTVTGAIIGVGSLNGFSAVRWGVARSIVWAWVLTIPASGCVAAAVWGIAQFFNSDNGIPMYAANLLMRG
ncbi:Low-affinity inorganic phosphate transporter 1 [Aquicella lusitana]|uniref:PiT family inorganic phosphate transporter n=2 Tax=Aquicella lusitana TaxID=254246 RepID=A0A370GZQ6_9COXI|nr:PiT family inorganic phosphate transporter [Aquicella lusitana]VVC73189.1 Low-affinity inorganic phosphate transporter 1 [Aquicella lusitana]